jgi:actin-related protein
MADTIVIDNGAYMIKASMAQDISPKLHFNGAVRDKGDKRQVCLGNKALDCISDGSFNTRTQQLVHP